MSILIARPATRRLAIQAMEKGRNRVKASAYRHTDDAKRDEARLKRVKSLTADSCVICTSITAGKRADDDDE